MDAVHSIIFYHLLGVGDARYGCGLEETIDVMIDRERDAVASEREGEKEGEPAKSAKLVHSSFRLEQDVISELQKAADKRGISLSSFVNKTLKNYVTSEMYFEELGFLLISKDFLRKIFSKLEGEKDIEEFGRELGKTIAKEYASYFYPQMNKNTIIQFLEIYFRRFQSYHHRLGQNSIDNTSSNKTIHSFTVNHDINMNFSLALQSILAGLIEPIIKSIVEFNNVTPNAITFSFEI